MTKCPVHETKRQKLIFYRNTIFEMLFTLASKIKNDNNPVTVYVSQSKTTICPVCKCTNAKVQALVRVSKRF